MTLFLNPKNNSLWLNVPLSRPTGVATSSLLLDYSSSGLAVALCHMPIRSTQFSYAYGYRHLSPLKPRHPPDAMYLYAGEDSTMHSLPKFTTCALRETAILVWAALKPPKSAVTRVPGVGCDVRQCRAAPTRVLKAPAGSPLKPFCPPPPNTLARHSGHVRRLVALITTESPSGSFFYCLSKQFLASVACLTHTNLLITLPLGHTLYVRIFCNMDGLRIFQISILFPFCLTHL